MGSPIESLKKKNIFAESMTKLEDLTAMIKTDFHATVTFTKSDKKFHYLKAKL